MKQKSSNLFIGGVFLLAGILIITERMGYLGNISLMTIILSVGLGGIILHSIPRLNFAGILFPAAGLCILFDNEWGITALTPWTVLITALLGSIGLSIIFRKKKHSQWIHHDQGNWSITDFNSFGQSDATDSSDGSIIQFHSRFGGGVKYVESDDFKRADLQCEFGGMKVYFDNAIIQGDSADIYLEASFGGVELYLPRNWQVENYTDVFLGGVDEHKGRTAYDYDKTVRIYGNVKFSGVEIYYV